MLDLMNPVSAFGQLVGQARHLSERWAYERSSAPKSSEGAPLSTKFNFLWFGLLAVRALGDLVSPALAGEAAYCLTCTSPDQTYLCRVTGEAARQNDVFKLYCIARTARKGRHASCAALLKKKAGVGAVIGKPVSMGLIPCYAEKYREFLPK